MLRVDPWSFDEQQGRVFHTATFSIYTTEKAPIITDRLPAFMEAALDQYISAIAPLARPSKRLESFVMGSRGQWQRLTLAMLGERGRSLTYIERGGFASGGRAFLFDIGDADTLSLASHEGWHQFTQSTFAQRLPTWAEEGIATYMEGYRWIGDRAIFSGWANVERFDHLREAMAKGEVLSLSEVLSSTPEGLMQRGFQGPVTYYSQLWTLMHFLHEGEAGKHRVQFQRLVSDAAAGRLGLAVSVQLNDPRAAGLLATSSAAGGAMVFRAYFGDPAGLEGAYRAFVGQVLATGARQAIVEGRSPIAPQGGRQAP
ncbi:MAG: hypothetical protein ACKVS8_13490 [Phycisphaerales bacterium]